MKEHEQRDAVRAAMLMVPGHEVYRSRQPPPQEEDKHRGGEIHDEPSVMDEDHEEW